MRRTSLITAALLTGLTSVVLVGNASPAHAEIFGVDDADDSPHGSDLFAVSVRNGVKKLKVTTTHDNLRRSPASGSGGAVYVDTDQSDAGPEYVFVGGYFEGTDYQLLHTEGFGPKKWGTVAGGSWSMSINYRADTVRMVMSKKALGGADDVRIGIRVSGTGSGGAQHVDWLGKRNQLTPWVAEG